MATFQDIQAEIVDDFSFLPEWDERYTYLIEIGQKMEAMPAEYKTKRTSSGAVNLPYGWLVNAGRVWCIFKPIATP